VGSLSLLIPAPGGLILFYKKHGNLADIVSSKSLDVLRGEVAAIASGELYYESEDIARLPGGEKRYNLFRLGVVRGHENSLDKVLFSLLDIHERKQAEEELRQRNRELSAASEILRTATTHLDLQVILDETLRGAVRLANMDSGSICLVVPERKELKLTASYNYADGKMELQPRSDIDHQLCNRVLKTGEFLIQDSDANIVTAGIPTGRKFFHAMFPMKVKEQTIGILCIFSESNNRPTGRSLELLKDLCGPIALAIENARLLSNLQRTNKELFRAYDTTLEGWAKALELRDKETEGHARRVVDLTLELAHRMKVRKADLTNIRRGILLHDIGKMGIPDNVLHKPGPLDASEWREMRQHPLYAYKLLHSINYLHPALDIPLYHHERWDGSGYPYGLKGEKIPVAARMFAVVDVWDALRSDRSYRKAWPKKKVLKYLRDEAGTRFDPNVVKSFLAMLTERRSM
jgi:HD-GYP domain-containing protein (c-di-GMP phosphodiesterase class II)